MPPKRAQLPRLDLPKFGISELGMAFAYPWNEEVERLFAPLIDKQPFESGTPYTVKGQSHLIGIMAGQQDESESGGKKRLLVGIRIGASSEVQDIEVPKSDRREAEIVPAILGLTEQVTIGCTIELVTYLVDASTLWFPLPTLVGDAPNVYEIRGVLGAKLSGASDSKEEFWFSMSRPTDESIHINLQFPLIDRFTLETPRKVVDRGITIARQLVGTTPRRRRPE